MCSGVAVGEAGMAARVVRRRTQEGRRGRAGLAFRPVPDDNVQRSQPPGVPPLELTGERTLPDVPAENYWFRRHLVVYEWIAERCGGLDVVDIACGEGYGVEVL